MIARTWRGATSASRADEYVAYLLETGVAAYRQTEGNNGVLLLRRIDGDRAEFLLVSLWESMDHVRRFAGADPERAVFYPEDDAFLVDRDLFTTHYEAITVP
jgi:heme-degrading monooxygenase HmoA